MTTHVLRATLILAAALGSASCDERVSSIAGPSPSLSPTFSSIVSEILTSSDLAGRVACTNCHTNVGRNPAGGLTLLSSVAYDQLVNTSSSQRPGVPRVIPGDPDGSYLMHKVEGRSGIVGRRMPIAGPPYLTDGQILILRRWIENGAPRN